MKLINLTPHPINLPAGTIQPSGQVARVSVSHGFSRHIDAEGLGDVKLVLPTYGDVEDLPGPTDDTFYIVSTPVQQACPDRDDLLVPADLIRDDQGRIVGANALALPAKSGTQKKSGIAGGIGHFSFPTPRDSAQGEGPA